MRSNTLKVFRQLSKWGLKEDQHNFSQLTSVRQPGRRSPRPGNDKSQSVEGSSNLFYYLFEDYSAAFDILNTSKAALDDIVRSFHCMYISAYLALDTNITQSGRILQTAVCTMAKLPANFLTPGDY